MKKNNLIMKLPIVVSVLILAIAWNIPYYKQFGFYLKHVVLYGLSVYLMCVGSYSLLSYGFKKVHMQKLIRLILISVVSGIVIVASIFVSNLQMKYIETKEIPPLTKTTYYDYYGNYLYSNQYQLSEISNVSYTYENDLHLTFQAEESAKGIISNTLINGNTIVYSSSSAVIDISVQIDVYYKEKSIINRLDINYIEMKHYNNQTISTKVERTIENVEENDKFITTENISAYTETLDYETDVPFASEDIKNYSFEDDVRNVYSSSIITKDQFNYCDIIDETTLKRKLYGRFNNDADVITITLDHYDVDGIYEGKTYSFSQQYEGITITDEMDDYNFQGYLDNGIRTVSFVNNDVFLGINQTDLISISGFESKTPYFDYEDNYTYDRLSNVYSEHNDMISKYYFTENGIVVEDYNTAKDEYGNFTDKERNPTLYRLENKLTDIYSMYTYIDMIETPGYLTEFHFYQHNMLIESFIKS